jgi:GT2 family glycosyltransferase
MSGLAHLFNSTLVDRAFLSKISGSAVLSDMEMWDLLRYCDGAAFRRVVPMFNPDHYQSQIGGRPRDNSELLSHYIEFGVAAWLMPHPLIDPLYVGLLRPDVFAKTPTIENVIDLLEHDLTDPSPFFSLRYYRSMAGVPPKQSSLLHFLQEGASRGLMPCAFLDPIAYRRKYSDVPADNLDAILHFIAIGDAEERHPGRPFPEDKTGSWKLRTAKSDGGPLRDYLAVRRFETDPETGAQDTPHSFEGPPFAEWNIELDEDSWIRSAERLRTRLAANADDPIAAFRENEISFIGFLENDPETVFRLLEFSEADSPDLDILIPFYNEFEHTVACLRSIQLSKVSFSYRVILLDDASPNADVFRFKSVPGLTVVRNTTNLHFLRSCNHGYTFCTAPLLLLLNNDTQLAQDGLEIMVSALQDDLGVGAVGPKILYPNGRLQESGCVLRADGTTQMIGVGDDPSRSRYRFPRAVDYISGACLIARRELIGPTLFDEVYAPAYCEDVDLCLRIRAAGKKILYCPDALLIHHLSASTSKTSRQRRLQLVTRNQATLVGKWSDALFAGSDVRVLSFYLPQFHPIAQNDLWWGKGFTEWTNVSRALPSFVGHYQPHLPADLGFYDLRQVDVMQAQQDLADRYGLSGFVVYYYNFGGIRMLETPLENLMARPDVNFRFCICWANENWTKHWDGGEKEALLTQLYDEATLSSICDDAVRYAADPRAIMVDGKPLFLLYRPLLLPDVSAFAAMMRQAFVKAGWPNAYLVYVESMEAISAEISPASIGFDACVEFPPQGIGSPHAGRLQSLKRDWTGHVYSYEETVLTACSRPDVAYPRLPCVFPSWDNTARQPLRGTSFQGASPELFQQYVSQKTTYLHEQFTGGEKLLFINAWNEWAEGAHLEPDRAYGHLWLEAVRNGVAAARFPASAY